MRRVVLDTNVVVSGLLWTGSPNLLLRSAAQGQIELFTSEALLAELARVLRRRKFVARVAASLLTVDQVVESYSSFAPSVIPVSIARVAADPDDDVVLGTALGAKADLVVSGDVHLLSIREFQGIPIVSATEAQKTCKSPEN